MGALEFSLLVAVLGNVAIFTNGHPQGPGIIARGFDGPASNTFGYDGLLPANDAYRYNNRLPATNTNNKLPANNAYDAAAKKLLSANPVVYKELPLNNAYENDKQQQINNAYNDKVPAISNNGYNNPSMLPALGLYGYDGNLPPKNAYGYVNEKSVYRPVFTTTPRPDFSNEPATTLPPLTPQQQMYVTLMNAVAGNLENQTVFQAVALG